jgi:hypothetical protein
MEARFPDAKTTEANVRNRLAERENGRVEVRCSTGIIDIVTPTDLIEVKDVMGWKGAFGQVMIYAMDYPFWDKRLHLFSCDSISEARKTVIVNALAPFGVAATFEENVVRKKRYEEKGLTTVCLQEYLESDGYLNAGKLALHLNTQFSTFSRTDTCKRQIAKLQAKYPGREIIRCTPNAPNGHRGAQIAPELIPAFLRYLDPTYELKSSRTIDQGSNLKVPVSSENVPSVISSASVL